jgi:hypothetical protein
MEKLILVALAATLAVAIAGGTAANTTPASDPALIQALEQLHGVYISDGEQMVLRADPDGRPVVVSRQIGVAPSTPAPSADTKVEDIYRARLGGPLKAVPGTLVASFNSFGAQGVVLRVDNGLGQTVLYDASIVTRRGEMFSVTPSSICPVAAGHVGVESWGPNVVGVVISNVRTPPAGNVRCSEGSGLVAHTNAANPNICRGGAQDAGIEVDLEVDPATGNPMNARAVWNPRAQSSAQFAPRLGLDYPMQNGVVGGLPTAAVALAIVDLRGPRPTAKTATIVLAADGVEADRRPWQLYAKQLASLDQAPPGRKPVAFAGAIPFPLRGPDGGADPKLQQLFSTIGAGKVRRLEMRAEGDDGSLLSRGEFDLTSNDIRDTGKVAAALQDALAKAKAPDHCAPPPPPRQPG